MQTGAPQSTRERLSLPGNQIKDGRPPTQAFGSFNFRHQPFIVKRNKGGLCTQQKRSGSSSTRVVAELMG